MERKSWPDNRGYFGQYGGKFVPETLMPALSELEAAYADAMADASFTAEFERLCRDYIGRPTALYHARQLSAKMGGAAILLKREDLAHTGAHKINNALGQGLLAKRMGKTRIIAETGAGQHGVAVAAVCAMLGLKCIIYMGEEDIRRQSPNVNRMKLMGAEVRPVNSGSRTLKDAINEAIRDWVSNVRNTHYLLAREQVLAVYRRLPDYLIACVGGGSNSIGLFHPFYDDKDVKFIGVEAGGKGLDTGEHSATLTTGKTGVLHGTKSYLMEDEHGQIKETHSIAPGLDYPGVGPEHSFYKDSGRASYVAVTDSQALEGFRLLSDTEGIIPALEPAHAIYYAAGLAKELPKDKIIIINLSGRGDKDLEIVTRALGMEP
jgi:tryptophan synthase beta chain